MDDLVILYTTWPDPETAETVGLAAVSAKLAACANILAPMTSIYRWKDELQRETETPMLLKTASAKAAQLREFILDRHPYTTPCLVALRCDPEASNPGFVRWIGDEIA
jgi:periplasmic divalent cation tolerance protein